jgi:hypothetical protein
MEPVMGFDTSGNLTVTRRIVSQSRREEEPREEQDVEESWRECLNFDLRALPMAEGSDCYGEGSHIETAPDFGCVHFEAKA